jgi:hypothetical protein
MRQPSFFVVYITVQLCTFYWLSYEVQLQKQCI